ncbi:MAG: TfoX/Sxy family protein [Cyclobacteriaceae bacterium]|nr:TfoX/Sxy family protein [Cytophagales bacterium]MBX2898448.1 TfoX/Sxy family protein [Cyclobacteriaceae bacterium]
MAYDLKLADRIREYLADIPRIKVAEKVMFSGMSFLVNKKMCVNVSHENLMCRFDPERFDEISERPGFLPMVMRGKQLNGYCYVSPEGFKSKRDFQFWMQLCLDYNPKAKISKSKAKKSK